MFRISEEGFDKKAFLEYAKAKEVEYNKLQHALIKTLAIRTRTRKQIIFEKRIKAELKKLRAQIKELRAQIWVASNKAYKKEDEKKVAEMKCHAFCYVELTKEVKELNITVHKFETEIARVKGEMLELNKKIVPDEQFQVTIAKYKKLQETLENKLDTNIRREGAVAADNARLRGEIIRLLRDKTYFNEQYTKLVERLNSNKKYLIDLVDYALNSFTQCMTIYDKMDSLVMQRDKDFAARKVEMQNLLRIKEGKDFKMQFLTAKAKERILADLQPKEYRRRAAFRAFHQKEIAECKDILARAMRLTQTSNVDQLITKYHREEGLYYSYFKYANEMNYRMTSLNNSVNRLYDSIGNLKNKNYEKGQKQLETIEELENELLERQESLERLRQQRRENDKLLNTAAGEIDSLFRMCNANDSPLKELLGDHTKVNLQNIRSFLKIFEKQIYDLVAYSYIAEREDKKTKERYYVVQSVWKYDDKPTEIDDIVLAQQCAECGEGEAYNEDAPGYVLSLEETKAKLYEEIRQPDLQYRMHSMSACRLPRSRLLVAKRDAEK